MVDEAGSRETRLDAEEARLARAAANGDGEAFATLYERYAQRAYNLALRLGGTAEDAAAAVRSALAGTVLRPPAGEGGEPPFRERLFAETRQATRERMHGQAPPRAEEIESANDRLPRDQREALALRELEGLPYGKVAATMELDRETTARLIAGARIDLRDELRGTSLASVSAASPRCERALGLLAMREDGELDPRSSEATWLVSHLAGCGTCGLAGEAMREGSASYRAWSPAAVPPGLFAETVARAAELVGSDWGEGVVDRVRPAVGGLPGVPPIYERPAAALRRPSRHPRRAALVATLAALGLGVVVAVVSAGEGEMASTPSGPAPAVGQATVVAEPVEPTSRQEPADQSAESGAEAFVEPVPSTEAPAPVPAPAGDPEPAPSGVESRSPGSANGGGGVAATEVVPEPQAELEPTPVPAESPGDPGAAEG